MRSLSRSGPGRCPMLSRSIRWALCRTEHAARGPAWRRPGVASHNLHVPCSQAQHSQRGLSEWWEKGRTHVTLCGTERIQIGLVLRLPLREAVFELHLTRVRAR